MGLLTLATGCAVTQPTLKIGLVAPFEGRYRAIGYDVIYAARLAVREINAAGGLAGYWIELVSLDDSGDAQLAEQQVAKLAVDSEVMAVIGHWLPPTTQASLDGYAQAGLALVATGSTQVQAGQVSVIHGPDCRLWSLAAGCLAELPRNPASGERLCPAAPWPAESTDPGFADRYRAVSNGTEPGPDAVLAYDSLRLVLAAIQRASDQGEITRQTVADALARTSFEGLAGAYSFDPSGARIEVARWAYAFEGGAWQPDANSRDCQP
jgi:ABC-type branched-subunit amino acid transport system substrate-binding protein